MVRTSFFNADGDEFSDANDLDSDDDGLQDHFEAHALVMDADTDGIANVFDADVTNGLESNSDGYDDRLGFENLLDSDTDGFPDHLDLDSDGDTITDLLEAGGVDNNYGTFDGFRDDDEDGGYDGFAKLGFIPIDNGYDCAFDSAVYRMVEVSV